MFVCLFRNKINLNEISHDSAIGLVVRVLNLGVLLTEVKVITTFVNSLLLNTCVLISMAVSNILNQI